jgi:hypothetical protein
MFALYFFGLSRCWGLNKDLGQLEGTSLELFLSICSSKLEANHACLQRLQLFLKMDVTTSTLFIFHVFHSKLGVVDL